MTGTAHELRRRLDHPVVDILNHEHLTAGATLQLRPWDVRILIDTTATTT